MKIKQTVIIIMLLVLFILGARQWLVQKTLQNEFDKPRSKLSLCDPTKKNCQFGDNGFSYTLQFSQKPSVLTPFNVSIRADHPQLKFIDLTFSMASMNMGFNHYRLVEAASSWRTNVILPVCSLGRNDWQLSVAMTFENTQEITVFKFTQ